MAADCRALENSDAALVSARVRTSRDFKQVVKELADAVYHILFERDFLERDFLECAGLSALWFGCDLSQPAYMNSP